MAKVKHRVGIRESIDTVFQTLTTNEGFSGWWASSADIEAEVGGRADLTFLELTVLSFEYKELVPNKVVQLKCSSGPGPWQDSELLFELEHSDDQVFLTLTHQNDDASEDDFLYFCTKWPIYLLSLRDLVETGEGRPYPNDIKIHYGD